MPDVICNTSAIQYLHQTNLLHLLHELYGLIVIPEGVLTELDAGRRAGVSLPDVNRYQVYWDPWHTFEIQGERAS